MKLRPYILLVLNLYTYSVLKFVLTCEKHHLVTTHVIALRKLIPSSTSLDLNKSEVIVKWCINPKIRLHFEITFLVAIMELDLLIYGIINNIFHIQ
jgi:hypothetical protein